MLIESAFKRVKVSMEQDLQHIDRNWPKTLQAYAYLRHRIVNMDIHPGALLSEAEVCTALSISKTPYREALRQLGEEGLIDIVPMGGTYCALIDLGRLHSGQLIRRTLERETVGIAAERYDDRFDREFDLLFFQQEQASERQDAGLFFDLDNAFHETICTVSKMPGVWNVISRGMGQLDRVRRLSFPSANHYRSVLNEHRQIYECLRARDRDGAMAAFDLQLSPAEKMFDLLERTYPHFFKGQVPISVPQAQMDR